MSTYVSVSPWKVNERTEHFTKRRVSRVRKTRESYCTESMEMESESAKRV